MALQKEIELDNGITVNYHRIVSINNITNILTTIEVAGYTSSIQREKEERYQELQKKNQNNTITSEEKEELEKGINVFSNTSYHNVEYNKDMNVDNAYEYLKKTDKFKDAKDV